MKLVAEFVCDEKFVIKEKNYGTVYCNLEFTQETIDRFAKYGLDSQYAADWIAREIKAMFHNAEYRPL